MTLLRAITREWGVPLLFVEGNAGPTPARLLGHHDPSRVLREDYTAENFTKGPLVGAMRTGGFLYMEEFNRAPEDTLNTLLTAMAERQVAIPRVGVITALESFRVIASPNRLPDSAEAGGVGALQQQAVNEAKESSAQPHALLRRVIVRSPKRLRTLTWLGGRKRSRRRLDALENVAPCRS